MAKTENKTHPDVWNSAIMSIMKYGISTIETSRSPDGKKQSFEQKYVRNIVTGPKNDEGDNFKRISNYNIRKGDMIATVCSHRLGDIFCWEASLSPAYVYNIDKFELRINRRAGIWGRMEDMFFVNTKMGECLVMKKMKFT